MASLARPPINPTIEEPVDLRPLLVDDIYLLGGQFAILCQFAHPSLAKGSFIHSSFASRVLARLRNTMRFINAAIYGTQADKDAIFSVIHKYHAHVHGDGYDANDPELHKWTAATMFMSIVVVHEAFFGKLPRDKLERMYRQSAVWGTSLRMTPDMWPLTLDDFMAYWHHNVATLEVTDMARKLANDLLYPINLPFRFRLTSPLARLLTAHWLPERLAKEYGLQTTTLSWLQYQAAVNAIGVSYGWLPERARTVMHEEYMADLKRSVKAIEERGHWSKDGKL